ncbi:DUF3987 domain-containing protein [Actinokineospora iranica]|nr:DUF3987 domain-containing protein [Actinokineospora iranica]
MPVPPSHDPADPWLYPVTAPGADPWTEPVGDLAPVYALPSVLTSTGTGTGTGTGAGALDDAAMGERVARIRGWLPPVDPAVFGCFLGQLATHLDPFTEADPVGVLVTLLAAAGVHMGPGPHVVVGGFERHPLLTWPIVVGPTGTGRKGTGYNVAKALLSHAIPEFVADNVHSGLSSGEGLASVFATDDTPGKGKPRLLPEHDVRLLAYEPEWASVMARMKREGNTLSATLRAAWEGGNLSTLNVDARTARQSHVGIVAHITPTEFRDRVSSTDMAGGTYNRFLPIAVAQSKFLPAPDPIDPTTLLQFGAALSDRLAAASRLDALTLDPDAAQLWRRLYVDFSAAADGDGDGVLAQFTSRAVPNCLRIAATYAALDRTDHITTTHLTAAAALVRYSIDSARVVLRPNDDLVKLLTHIREHGPQGCTREQARDAFQRNKSAADVGRLLDHLVTAGQVTATSRPPAGGRGRPATVFTATTPRG